MVIHVICLASFTTNHDAAVRVVFNSVFRSVDVAYHESLQRLSWTNEVFKEEVTIVHRKHLEDHITEQHSSSLAIDRIASQWEQSQIQIRESEQTAQKGPYLSSIVMTLAFS